MINITSLIGSRSNKSKTAYLANMIVDNMQKTNPLEKIRHELIQPDKWNISPCISCNTCFKKGFCPVDEKDGINVLKEKLASSDLIIFGSPVYAWNVSGDMKHLIDRLSMWLHTMPLIGRFGIVISTTYSNGGDTVINYLCKMMEHMGLQVLLQLNSYTHNGEPNINDAEKLNTLMNDAILKLSKSLIEGVRPPFSDSLKAYYAYNSRRFTSEKEKLEVNNKTSTGELAHWEKQGYLPFRTIEELAKMKFTD